MNLAVAMATAGWGAGPLRAPPRHIDTPRRAQHLWGFFIDETGTRRSTAARPERLRRIPRRRAHDGLVQRKRCPGSCTNGNVARHRWGLREPVPTPFPAVESAEWACGVAHVAWCSRAPLRPPPAGEIPVPRARHGQQGLVPLAAQYIAGCSTAGPWQCGHRCACASSVRGGADHRAAARRGFAMATTGRTRSRRGAVSSRAVCE